MGNKKASMIPEYLKGKSAPEILAEFEQLHSTDGEILYIRAVHHHLLLAVLHALCACDGTHNEPEAAGRAIAFLNSFLPYPPPGGAR